MDKKQPHYTSTARVVDGTLILSLPGAINPTVWQMELGNARASALEVRAKEDGSHMLLLKTPRGDAHDIAPFETKAEAISALMAASRAMEQAHGHIRPQFANNNSSRTLPALYHAPQEPRSNKTAMKIASFAIIAGVLVIIANVVLYGGAPRAPESIRNLNPASGSAAVETGTPISADDYLREIGNQ